MFTGIVAARGTIVEIERLDGAGGEQDPGSVRLQLDAGEIIADLPHGGSLAVDGVCLTATTERLPDQPGRFLADVMGETLRRTTLGELRPGSVVNLERCTRADGRLDGHVVQGHVDAVGTIVRRTDFGTWETLRIGVPAEIAPLLAEKGAIAVDGVSLTVTAVSPARAEALMPTDAGIQHWFEIGLIPATLEATGLGAKRVGSRVNLETDVMAKYAARLTAFRQPGEPVVEPTVEPTAGPPVAAPTATASAAPDGEIRLDTVAEAVQRMREGGAVVVVDDEDRENEGDLIFAAAHATPELVGFTIRHTSGVLCVPMGAERADALGLPPMTAVNEDAKGTAYTVTCDARDGVTTGISAADRATTARVLADPQTDAAQLTRPGHMLPLRAVPGGVLARRGHTEAGVDLCRLAGLAETAVIAEIVHDDGSMQRLPELRVFATQHGLPLISIAELEAWLRAAGPEVDAGSAAGTGAAASPDATATGQARA